MTKQQIKQLTSLETLIWDKLYLLDSEIKTAKSYKFCNWTATWRKKAVNTAIKIKDYVKQYDAEFSKIWNLSDNDCLNFYVDFSNHVDFIEILNKI